MWSGVRIVTLAVLCLGVSTPTQARTCSRQLSDGLLRIGACFLGVQRLQQEARKFTDIPNLTIGSSFTVSNIRVTDLKVKNSGCHVGSVAIPPPPTEPIVTLLPMDTGSGEQPTTPVILPPVRRNRRYTVTYRGILARASAVWRRRRGWSWYQGGIECTATGTVTIQVDAGIDRDQCPVFNNARCTATVGPVQIQNIQNRRYLGSYYEQQLRNGITKQINQEINKGCQAAAKFLQDAENNPHVLNLFRG